MTPMRMSVRWLTVVMVACNPGIVLPQARVASWLDQPKPASWVQAGSPIPAAPKVEANDDPRCKEQARPAESAADKRLRGQGWDLVGPYQGGWGIVVIRATAAYDGMCRPVQYQDFVFVRGAFAGTLSPQPVDSRSDGAIVRVSLLSNRRLTVDYHRYAASDPLCCPSRTTSVMFEIAEGAPVVRPVSASTSRVQ